MVKHTARLIVVGLASLLLAACGQKLDLELRATMEGHPAGQAKVVVDGQDQGMTDDKGIFTTTLTRKAGTEVALLVSKEMPGFRITPWKKTFLVKLAKNGVTDKYVFDVDLPASRFTTFVVTEKGAPVADARVALGAREIGKTDAKGEFLYEYTAGAPASVDVSVTKPGYAAARKTLALEPGQRREVAILRRAVLTVTALTEEYGQTSGVAGVAVTLDGKPMGKTNDKGVFSYIHDGQPGKRVPLVLTLPGYIPAEWKTTGTLEGHVAVQRYFYPTTAKQIRVGLARFGANSPGVDLKDVVVQAQTAIGAQLFKFPAFREVPATTLEAEIARTKVSLDRIAARGWSETPLRKTVDMIVLGSVARDDKGFLIEAKFYTAAGRLILSQITRARTQGDIAAAAKDIAANAVDRFPFEGTVTSEDEDRYRVNIGRPYRILRGTEFTLTAPKLGEAGKVVGYREIGRLKVTRVDDDGSLAEVDTLDKGEKVTVGDRVVRRIYHEGDEERARNYLVVAVKGGVASAVAPLAGVNIYLNNDWVGTTGSDGRAEVPLRLGKNYTIVLYRHGYQQVSEKIKTDKSGDTKEFVLNANNAIFKVESEPSRASIDIDNEAFGTTPLLDGKPVAFGFHTVRLKAGEDYRAWEEVVEFDKQVEDRTGSRKIVLPKDYLKIGERAVQNGDLAAAIRAYAATDKTHPDYSEAHHRLGQLYLDEKNDYDGAIREFENVLARPENRELIYKQFAVVFTNLGHAYYEKGNQIVEKDRDSAAQSFAKAVQALQTAKQNSRFFPTQEYDTALHDTYYYLALSYHRLYLITRKAPVLNTANLAFREYFDFFPKRLQGNGTFEQSRESARKYWEQIKDQ